MSAKYPRTFHLPFSPGGTSDDRRLASVDAFLGVPVVISEKYDGSNLTITKREIFARSHAGAPAHPSFDMAKQVHAQVAHNIPEGVSVFGEWLFAVHSIEYTALPGYFCAFGVREDTTGFWWEWSMVEMLAQELQIPTVPVLFRGSFDSEKELTTSVLEFCKAPSSAGGMREGIVIRRAEGFTDFASNIAKWVRSDHVTTSEHWKHQTIRRNRLA